MKVNQKLPHFQLRQSTKTTNFKEQFEILNNQNKELVRLAEYIEKSTFMHHPQYPAIVYNFEQELRNNLSAFIDGIRQFFMDMDTRLRSLGEAVAQEVRRQEDQAHRKRINTVSKNDPFGRNHMANQNITFKINQNTHDPFQMFSERIATLESNLKTTQDNQGRLLAIVEKLSKKSQEQSSYRERMPSEQMSFENRRMLRNPSKNSFQSSQIAQTSFRLVSLKTEYSPLEQSPHFRTVSQPQQIITEQSQPRPFCRVISQPPQMHKQPDHLRYRMDQTTSSSAQVTNSQHHRMNFLLKGLNK